MSDQQLADVNGVVIDLAKVPDHGPGASSGGIHLERTGQGYVQPDGTSGEVCRWVADGL